MAWSAPGSSPFSESLQVSQVPLFPCRSASEAWWQPSVLTAKDPRLPGHDLEHLALHGEGYAPTGEELTIRVQQEDGGELSSTPISALVSVSGIALPVACVATSAVAAMPAPMTTQEPATTTVVAAGSVLRRKSLRNRTPRWAACLRKGRSATANAMDPEPRSPPTSHSRLRRSGLPRDAWPITRPRQWRYPLLR